MALLAELEEPIDLVLCDPPWALRRGSGHFADGNGYRRDHTRVVPGYVDIDVERYLEFTHGWVTQAAAALRPAGQLAVITGPQRAAIVQHAAENARLTWFSSIVARREFPLATLRRPASAHWTITVMCSGALGNPRRVFNPPRDLPAARSGHPYPLDWWAEGNGRADRARLLRYDNSLPLPLVLRLVQAFSDPGEHVVDPFVGGRHHRDRVLADRTTVHRRRPQPARDQIHRRAAAVRARLAGRSPTQPALGLGASGRRPGTYTHRRFPCL